MRSRSRGMVPMVDRRWILKYIAGIAISSTGCGTVFYPERRGQPAGDLDWKIVGLDALGLIFFFVPGVIAFAVDFATGAIYLPADDCTDAREPTASGLVRTNVPPEDLSLAKIESAVTDQIGRPVRLEKDCFRFRPLKSLGEFWKTREQEVVG